MSVAADNFDAWIRSRFVEINTELEEIYFSLDEPSEVENVGELQKQSLIREGLDLVNPLVKEGNTEKSFESAFDVLGNLGLYLAALRRHEITNPDREEESPFTECSALGMHIAASIGVAPRFATAHLTTHNRAIDGKQKSFTSLIDEKLFNDYNLLGILSFKRAGRALMQIPAMGISAEATAVLLEDARDALENVVKFNKTLFDTLDVRRFFYCVRPYFKPYRVGKDVYRGANAGDFAEINQIDLLLGLCRGNDLHYAQILEEKILYMTPDDQKSLRRCLGMKPLLDCFLDEMGTAKDDGVIQTNCERFLEVCEWFAKTAAQHQNMLVSKFIERPAEELPKERLNQLTASGPPLPQLLNSLSVLRDRRMAVERDDIETAFSKLEELRTRLACCKSEV